MDSIPSLHDIIEFVTTQSTELMGIGRQHSLHSRIPLHVTDGVLLLSLCVRERPKEQTARNNDVDRVPVDVLYRAIRFIPFLRVIRRGNHRRIHHNRPARPFSHLR